MLKVDDWLVVVVVVVVVVVDVVDDDDVGQEVESLLLKEAKLAKERVLKLSTLEQLQSTLLDRHQKFKKHFFCVFVAGRRM